MTNNEFSNEFDVLYQNITSNQAPGLDEYEKSVFLSKAQDEIVKSYFDPKTNKPQEGFDGSEKRQIDFSMLIVTEKAIEATVQPVQLFPLQHTKVFAVPDKILMFINESLTVTRDGNPTYLTVVPLDYKEYNRLMSKPYKRPLKNQAWRILTNTTTISESTNTNYASIATIISNLSTVTGNYNIIYNTIKGKVITFGSNKDARTILVAGTALQTNGTTAGGTAITVSDIVMNNIKAYIDVKVDTKTSVVELIPGPNDTIDSYVIRYVKRPRAIILTDLEGVTLDGKSTRQECELDPILHQEILQRAVELAKISFEGTSASHIQGGNQSGTDKGYVMQQSK